MRCLPQNSQRSSSRSARAHLCSRGRFHHLILAWCCGECTLRPAAGSGFPYSSTPENDLGDLALTTCNVDSVHAANMAQLHPILHDLVNTTFFRLFRVGKTPKCAFWKTAEDKQDPEAPATCKGGGGDGFAGLGLGAAPAFGKKLSGGSKFGQPVSSTEKPAEAHTACGVEADTEAPPSPAGSSSSSGSSFTPSGEFKGSPLISWVEDLAGSDADIRLDRSKTQAEQAASELRDKLPDESCEFEEDLPTYWVDMCSDDHTKNSDVEDINLIKNPERNTGYNGSHIWEAMYNENCFEVGSDMPRGRFGQSNGMCYEERVLYRLLSGWHACTTISIFKNYYAPGTKVKGAWAPNVEKYMQALGKHPERVKNLHFSFVVMLRAIKKAAPFLYSYNFPEGEGQETSKTRNLVRRLLDSQVLSLCSPLFEAFDETRLFRDTTSSAEEPDASQSAAVVRSRLKRQFKSTFKNITELVDCVQCQRCRLHAKLFSSGLGSALKILLTPPELIPSTTSRDEVVALLNVLWKLSEAIQDATDLSKLYWAKHESEKAAPAPPRAPQTLPTTSDSFPPAPSKPPPAAAYVAPAYVAPVSVSRDDLLDGAISAVKRASAAGQLSPANELVVLRYLVVQKPSTEVLMLAKHYAADRPEVFVQLALEASSRVVPSAAAAVSAILGTAEDPADAVVIGGGLAGMVAAVTLLDRGARVVLVDKQPYLGGNSGKASSGINSALNSSVESLIKDTTKSAAELNRPDLINKLAQDSAEAVGWLRDRTGVDLSQRCQLGGHTEERTLRPSNAFVGAELTFAIGEILKKAAADRPDQFRLMLKSMWRDLDSNGAAGWRVSVEDTKSQAKEALQATSVVIASGGFGYDVKEIDSYLMKYRPDLKDFPTTLGAHTTGDGIHIAEKIGAKLVDMDRVQLHPTGFVNPAKPEDHVKTLAAELLRGAGGLLLDRSGSRFTDELGTRKAVVNAMLEKAKSAQGPTAKHFSLVLNGKAAAKQANKHATLYSKKGLLTKVESLDGLAAHLGVKQEKLLETFEAYNTGARAGKGEFGRIIYPAGHWPIESNESFYVGAVTPVIHYTMGGIAIDTNGRVLSKADEPFPGLYAAGEASGGVHGDNRLAGNSLLECTVFGRHVGLTLPIRQSEALPQVPIVETPAAKPLAEVPVEVAPAPIPEATANRKISPEELASKKKEGLSWVALYGKVYDLTEYVEEHPGGMEAITDVAGVDGTETFESVHNKELLDSMGFEPIGELVAES